MADRPRVAVVFTGAGDKAFCSGADLGGGISGENLDIFEEYARLITRLATFPKPSVARINGYCMAGGTGFMLGCDIVIAKETAKFGTPEVNVGLFPMMIGALIYRNVLRKKAMEMVLLGHKLDAEQAREMGLITRAVSPQKLDAEVAMTLKLLAAKSPIGIKIGKEAFYAMADMPFEDALDFLPHLRLQALNFLFKVQSVVRADVSQFVDLFLQLRDGLFEIEIIGVHGIG